MLKNISQTRLAQVVVIAVSMFVLCASNAAGQEGSVTKSTEIDRAQVQAKRVALPDLSLKRATLFPATPLKANTALPSSPSADSDSRWLVEIRPYLWAAGIYGRLRIRNTTVDTGQSSTKVLGMLDFAAASQLEAKKDRWSLMFDENYANLGTTVSGPLGNSSVKVEPTLNVMEFGASYEFVRAANEAATAANPLPPILSAEVLGGARYVHFGLGLQPENLSPVEGSRNLFGVFVGNRVKVRPHKAVTLTGKYTVGTSGVGSNFAWSADALVDLRLSRKFSFGGGYRWLGLNADDPGNTVGFDGQMRGLILTATIYH